MGTQKSALTLTNACPSPPRIGSGRGRTRRFRTASRRACRDRLASVQGQRLGALRSRVQRVGRASYLVWAGACRKWGPGPLKGPATHFPSLGGYRGVGSTGLEAAWYRGRKGSWQRGRNVVGSLFFGVGRGSEGSFVTALPSDVGPAFRGRPDLFDDQHVVGQQPLHGRFELGPRRSAVG